MKQSLKLPSLDLLQELFTLDSKSGKLYWKTSPAHQIKVGTEAGYKNIAGYKVVTIKGQAYLVHRIIWFMFKGTQPLLDIDHIDGNKINNTPANLRDVSRTVNRQNIKKAPKNNSTGLLGTTLLKGGKFQASINVNGKCLYLGRHDTAQKAHKAYLEAKRKYHPGCTI